jgi:hypothetical protein
MFERCCDGEEGGSEEKSPLLGLKWNKFLAILLKTKASKCHALSDLELMWNFETRQGIWTPL